MRGTRRALVLEGDRPEASRACLPIQTAFLPYLCIPVSCLRPRLAAPPCPLRPSSLQSSAPGTPWLDSRQPQFCRRANQAGCWRRQMAGGTNRGLEMAGRHRHMLHELAYLKNRKATVSFLCCPLFRWVLTPF